MRAPCATCIFSSGNSMSLRPGRLRTMVETCRRHDVCHERMVRVPATADPDTGLSEINFNDPVCRGFYDACPGVGQMIRISDRLGMLREVD